MADDENNRRLTRRYVENASNSAYSSSSFRENIDAFEHPRRAVLPRTLPSSGDYVSPNLLFMRGLENLNIITGSYFRPGLFSSNIVNNPNGFVPPTSPENVAWSLFRSLSPPVGERSAYLYPMNGSIALCFPLNDSYDLPSAVFIYLLYEISKLTPHNVYNVLFCLDLGNRLYPPDYHVVGKVNYPVNGLIYLNRVYDIYIAIMTEINRVVRGYDRIGGNGSQRGTWNGSDESGTRIVVKIGRNQKLIVYIELKFVDAQSVTPTGSWSNEIQKVLDEVFPSRCYLTVKNIDDDMCFLYCILLGIMSREGYPWVVGQEKVIDSATIKARGKFYSKKPSVNKIADEMYNGRNRLQEIGLNVGDLIDIQEFRSKMDELEKRVLVDDLSDYAVDIYLMEYNRSKHIYPVFTSSRDVPYRIPLLNLQTTSGNGHFILITDMKAVFAQSGGKIFYNCGLCKKAFYTRSALLKHPCKGLGGKDEYHWSRSGLVSDAPPYGVCNKCMLKFVTDFEYNYHMDHCFMEGKSGFRHVKCLDSDGITLPTLKGEIVDRKKEEKRNKETYILFADFESAIDCSDPSKGVHTVMSYGLYNEHDDEFIIGYDLESFMRTLYGIAINQHAIYVYFHNAMNYDANFILRYVLGATWTKDWGIDVIMKSSARLQKMTFRFNDPSGKTHKIHIGDTFLFLTMSLDRIVSSIRTDNVDENKVNFPRFFRIFSRKYPGIDVTEFDQILHKNLFPYRFFTTPQQLEVSAEAFLSIFEPKQDNLVYFSENITVADLAEQYEKTKHVMSLYECETARDYHDIYLTCDVLQIADVFMKTINTLWDSHHIFLPKYIGMPAASWNAFLRHDPMMEIPLYSQTIFAEFFSSMTRGGVTSAPLRHAVADDLHSIIYLDVNGLYPHVMRSFKYPSDYFLWVNFDSVPKDQDLNVYLLQNVFPSLEETGEGMALTVDLHYTEELKHETDDYPFAPEHRVIYDEYFDDKGTLRGFLHAWSEVNDEEKMHPFKGLVGTLYDKEQYTCHWRLLKWYIEHGLIVTKLWWGVRFNESDYLAGYVSKNIELRNKRSDPLGKMVYKLMGNSIYGKTFESPFKRGKFMIERDEVKLRGIMEEGNISSITPIDDLGWVIKMDGDEIVLNKPTFIGACVCEYAKLHMYILLYDKLKRIFPKVELVYTDTDSFIVRVEHPLLLREGENVVQYIERIQNDPTGVLQGEKLIGSEGGLVKSETGYDTIEEVIALRSKVYCYRTKGGHEDRRAKGTTHAAQEEQLNWEAYKNALETMKSKTTTNMQFQRKGFRIKTVELERQSLSANDGKRYICDDGIHTHAWGYFLN